MRSHASPHATIDHARSRSSLVFDRAPDGRSYLARQQVRYPFHVTAPFALPERPAGMATLYLQSVSGGLYDGDEVSLELRVGEGAAAHVTTQSPGVVNRARGRGAAQRVAIEVAPGALLEYLPDPVVMLPDAWLRSRVDARVAAGATLLVADGLLAHDPAGAGAAFDRWDSRLCVRDTAGRALLDERNLLAGACHLAAAERRGGAGRCLATLVAVQPARDPGPLLDAARAALAAEPALYAGASALPRDAGICVRVLAAEADALARAMHGAWSAIRIAITGAAPAARRK